MEVWRKDSYDQKLALGYTFIFSGDGISVFGIRGIIIICGITLVLISIMIDHIVQKNCSYPVHKTESPLYLAPCL